MKFGIGIVGCGMIARFHAMAIAEIEHAELVACFSRNLESATAFANEHAAEAFESLDAMLADDRVQVVIVCTPSGAHLEPAVAAAKAGKHVVVEKPLEVTLERCDAIIEACADNDVTLSTIFPSRFHESSRLLKGAVDQGRFGTLTLGDAYVKWFRSQEYYDSGKWRGTWQLDGGGALMNQAIHNVDLLLWLMGPVADVSANTATLCHERIEVEDVATATLRFKNGALGVIEASTAAFPGMLKKIEIHGNQGSVVIEEEDIKTWQFAEMTDDDTAIAEKFAAVTSSGGGAGDPSAIGHAAHAKQLRSILGSIETGTPLEIDGAEGRRSVELILAIYESARSGQRVSLPLGSVPNG